MLKVIRTKPQSFRRIHGAGIVGRSIFSRAKRFIQKIMSSKPVQTLMNNKTVRSVAKNIGKRILSYVPGVTEKVIGAIGPKIQSFEDKNPLFKGATEKVKQLANQGAQKVVEEGNKYIGDGMFVHDAPNTKTRARKRPRYDIAKTLLSSAMQR